MTHKHTRVTHIMHEIIYYYLMYTIDDKDVILLSYAGNTGQQWHLVEMLQQGFRVDSETQSDFRS